MSAHAAQLGEMGFAPEQIARAAAALPGASLEQAMEWLLSHADDGGDGGAGAAAADASAGAGGDAASAPAADPGLRCTECGATFPAVAQAEAHANKTGHASFEEVEGINTGPPRVPLTPEEVAERAAKLKARLAAARVKREGEEAEAERLREIARRETGKSSLERKRQMEEDAIRRAAEQKRKEKEAERAAREKVRADIERDKQARRDRQAAQRALASGTGAQASVPAPTPAGPIAVSGGSREYTECLLQIRLTNGSALRATFQATDTLAKVCDHVRANRTDGDAAFTLMTPLPRKIFTAADMSKTLKDLDLGPRAALTVTRS